MKFGHQKLNVEFEFRKDAIEGQDVCRINAIHHKTES